MEVSRTSHLYIRNGVGNKSFLKNLCKMLKKKLLMMAGNEWPFSKKSFSREEGNTPFTLSDLVYMVERPRPRQLW